MSSENQDLISLTDVKKSFQVGEQTIQILHGISMKVNYGDFLIIFGPSGCGKSTLLHIILGLEVPTEGQIIFLGENIYQDTHEDYRSTFRKKHIGMIYQQANWIKSMNVLENVAFPLMLLGLDKESAMEKALAFLQQVKMENWAYYTPTELSGGQQQRIALARSLINNPEIIIADEPTGNLDFQSGQEVMMLLNSLNRDQGKTIIMVTHDLEYLKYAKSAVQIFDGSIQKTYTETDIGELLSTIKYKRGEATKTEEQVTQVTTAEEKPKPTIRIVPAPSLIGVSH